MTIIDVELINESQTRYLTYALSVVSSRALPDVRDGLKPVQRRILYAMSKDLHLYPDKNHRKSAAVVGEVLARYHPHGDSACYDAMVRMAQDFSLRYPLVDGQGNFGSLDGDAAAAYRYTEAKLTQLALEVIGDIGEQTVAERDNFDQTVKEPVVLPSRVPHLLMNGASGIAVGMATAIPPHNLAELVKALLLLLEDSQVSDTKIYNAIKAPDFPTACSILNTKEELREIYQTGRGAVRMRADYEVLTAGRGKQVIIVSSIPYGVDKSAIVERIAEVIIAKKVPQLDDVRDESTAIVRIVLELAAGANSEKVMAYLFKHTPLQQNFNVNLTALVPTANPFVGRPVLMSLREFLEHFVAFRLEVTRNKLLFEKSKLEERIHLLEGLARIIDVIDEVIDIVRKSSGRSDAAEKLQKRFKLTELQALFIVDLRIYQLSRTNIDEVVGELKEKTTRVKEIERILKSDQALRAQVSDDLQRISKEYGDERRSKVQFEFEEVQVDEETYRAHEDVYVIVTKDGWLKRIGQKNDPGGTRLREGDSLFFTAPASTRDLLALFSNQGNVFVCNIFDLSSTSGYGEPVQKMFRFQDGEQIVSCMHISVNEKTNAISPAVKELLYFTSRGFGFRMSTEILTETKKTGKRLVRLGVGDKLVGVAPLAKKLVLLLSAEGYGICCLATELPLLSNAGKGVILQRIPQDDALVVACPVNKEDKILVEVEKGLEREIDVSSLTISSRAKRGLKLVKRGAPVKGLAGKKE